MIEKFIHRLWLGPDTMPEEYAEYGRQWQQMNPDWTLLEWTYKNIDLGAMINRNSWDIAEMTAKAQIPMDHQRAVAVQRADILSYELVYRFGGVYLNTDIQPIRPLDELVEQTGERAFACYEGEYNGRRYLVNAVLGGPKKHPFWKACIEDLPIRFFNSFGAPMETTTGPHLVTDIFERGWPEDQFVALDEYYFNPVHFGDIETGGDASDRVEWAKEQGAYGLHHWGHRKDQAKYG